MEPFIDKSGYIPHDDNAPEHSMGAAQWLSTHIYTTLCVAAGILLVIGALIVKTHAPASAGNSLQVWGGGQGTLIMPQSGQNPVLSNVPPPDLMDNSNVPTFTALPVTKPPSGTSPTDDTFDVAAFAASLQGASIPSAAATQTNTAAPISYDFIPQGLISTSSPGRARTAAQQALYEYGNDAGSYIQSYEDAHRNTAPALTDQIKDRQNPQKIQAVKDIAAALRSVGTSLTSMDDVPESVRSLNLSLGEGYITIADKLSLVPDAAADSAFINAIKAYDSSVDAFTQQFVAVAQYLSLSGVTFQSTDPGSVFTFSGGGGL